MANDRNGRDLDRGTRLILAELRDLRTETRADRRQTAAERQRMDEERRKADEAWRQERRQVDEERRRADEAWRAARKQADETLRLERKQAEATRRQDLQRSDERFEQMIHEFRQDSARREAVTQKAFKDIRTVGLSIVKTLNHHTRLLERIDRKLGPSRNGPPPPGHGGRA